MRIQSASSSLTYSRRIPISRIASALADKAQVNTQTYGKRPYGVGLLVAGCDETGPHLFEFMPSGLVQEFLGGAIGARSQSARTYLERNFEEFSDASKEELVEHGLKALRDSLPQDKELTIDNTSVAIVGMGKGEGFKLFEGQDVAAWLETLGDNRSSRLTRTTREQEAAEADAAEAMETD
jgi:20S proteasome subunit alpha 6